ncbi:hypothetical protein D8Y22_16810 [Salinadaptatus halalkaliphilus]|uniref:Uncharacterized protein n=1 Tax=Salinadaptatus halalkaliphilus TaxID=2419781 RepID=A0A4S3THV9_9EURY|nr:hypothetical protein [Salinadaptatus halalkaliphilus]THE63492.1 hypothetical protein D8Y22_16810 [Salinadaptatus halalkaliphilus]
MDRRQRVVVGLLWVGVAALMSVTLDLRALPSLSALASLFVVLVALFLAVVYLFDPWGVLERQPFH